MIKIEEIGNIYVIEVYDVNWINCYKDFELKWYCN